MYNTITLYELMDRSCDSIEASPGNYYQGAWSRPAADIESEQKNACGTAFCRAGFMMMHVHEPKTTAEWCVDAVQHSIESDAKHMLYEAGIDYEPVQRLFLGAAIDYRIPVGSPRYIAEGIKGMRDFMRQNATKLKAATVQVWEPDPVPDPATGDTDATA